MPKPKTPLRVRIAFTVEIDPDAWQLNYGTAPKDVRKDVQNYAENVVYEQFGRDVLPENRSF